MAKENIFVPKEKDLTTPAAKKAAEMNKGNNPDQWSDGEIRIIDDLKAFNYAILFCIPTGEILMMKDNLPVPRTGEIVILSFPAGSLEQKYLAKLFKVEAKITKHIDQAFHFKVTSVESKFSDNNGSWTEYTIIMEPIENQKEFVRTVIEGWIL